MHARCKVVSRLDKPFSFLYAALVTCGLGLAFFTPSRDEEGTVI